MMDPCVPGFNDVGDNCLAPPSPGFFRPKKFAACDEDIMELLWQNGEVVVQRTSMEGIRPTAEEMHLFTQEDEMASLLHYPIDDSSVDRDLYSDLLCSNAPPAPMPAPVTTVAPPRAAADNRPQPPRPPVPPADQKFDNSPRFQNFVHFSRIPSRHRTEPPSKHSVAMATESTVVQSNKTPMVVRESRVSHTAADCRTHANLQREAVAASATAAATREMAGDTCEMTVSSSPGGSGSSFSASAEPRRSFHKPTTTDNRKRKSVEAGDSEETEFEPKRRARGSTSTKRSRAAEVHNLSERRRRDRINEKMRALQQLVPGCNRTDKASMLDEAIEYLKSLQLQVQNELVFQMMSMGWGVVPMMYPGGMQRYMAPMGMGLGMEMAMATSRPLLPYPSIPNQASLPVNSRFHLPQVPLPDSSRTQASSQGDPMVSPHNPFDPAIQNRLPTLYILMTAISGSPSNNDTGATESRNQ